MCLSDIGPMSVAGHQTTPGALVGPGAHERPGARARSASRGRLRQVLDNTRAGSLPSESREQNQRVCIFHLKGLCRFGDSCFNFHSNMQFQWFFRKLPDSWIPLYQKQTYNLEMQFSQPANFEYYINIGYELISTLIQQTTNTNRKQQRNLYILLLKSQNYYRVHEYIKYLHFLH